MVFCSHSATMKIMKAWLWLHNHIVAALVLLFLGNGVFGYGAAFAQDTAKLDELFTRLTTATEGEAGRIEREIWLEWSKSGSPAMDLLLQRGRNAMEAGDTDAAIEHFTALIDHDPAFAEGWNARATAYFTAGEFGPSIADIAQTLTLNPRHFGAMSGMATILEQLGKPEQALKMLRTALAIHPHLAGVEDAIKRLEKDAEGQEL